jgi:AmmeMemoRadiSam system protein A
MNDDRGRILLEIARASINEALGLPVEIDNRYNHLEWLQKDGACFVTLTQNKQLRGCIGSLEAHRSLLSDVRSNAVSAALNDTRFTPLSVDELDATEIEVSLLSPHQEIKFNSEQDALNQLLPDVDGVIFEAEGHRSTFLPQVWESLHEAKEFLSHLKLKAGLPQDYWSEKVKLYRYTVMKWKERDLGLTAGRRDQPENETAT